MLSLVIGSNLLATKSHGQKADPFADIPSSQRERLRSRILEFVEYHRTKQWNRVYDLLAERGKNAVEGGLPRDVFLKKKLYSTVKKFTTKSVQKMDNDWWMLWGCADFGRDGNMEAAFEAILQDGDWYFSDIWSSPPCIDCMPRSCKH